MVDCAERGTSGKCGIEMLGSVGGRSRHRDEILWVVAVVIVVVIVV
jgi:hypothetical protein